MASTENIFDHDVTAESSQYLPYPVGYSHLCFAPKARRVKDINLLTYDEIVDPFDNVLCRIGSHAFYDLYDGHFIPLWIHRDRIIFRICLWFSCRRRC